MVVASTSRALRSAPSRASSSSRIATRTASRRASVLHLGEEPLLGLLGRQARDPLELPALLVDQRLLPRLDLLQTLLPRAQALLARVVVAVPTVELVEPARDLLLLLAQPALEALELLLALAGFLLELGPSAIHDFLGLDGGVLQAGLRVSLGLLQDAPAVLRNISEAACGDLPLEHDAGQEGEREQDDRGGDDQDDERGGFQDRHLPSGPRPLPGVQDDAKHPLNREESSLNPPNIRLFATRCQGEPIPGDPAQKDAGANPSGGADSMRNRPGRPVARPRDEDGGAPHPPFRRDSPGARPSARRAIRAAARREPERCAEAIGGDTTGGTLGSRPSGKFPASAVCLTGSNLVLPGGSPMRGLQASPLARGMLTARAEGLPFTILGSQPSPHITHSAGKRVSDLIRPAGPGNRQVPARPSRTAPSRSVNRSTRASSWPSVPRAPTVSRHR